MTQDDYHDPTAGWAGAPPARSALTLRLILALFGLTTCTAAAVAFVTVVDEPAFAAAMAALAFIALVDTLVVLTRKHREAG